MRAFWRVSGLPKPHSQRVGKTRRVFRPQTYAYFLYGEGGAAELGQCGNQRCPCRRGQLARPGVGRAVGGHWGARLAAMSSSVAGAGLE